MDSRKTHLGSLGLSHSRTYLTVKNTFDLGLSLWLQPSCFLCKKSTTNGVLCETCNQFHCVLPPYCFSCGDTISFGREKCGKCEKRRNILKQVRSTYWLCESAQKILHEIKFRSDRPVLSFLIKSHLDAITLTHLSKDTWIVPIPLLNQSFFDRGFNQSEILAENIAEKHGLNFIPDALIKIRKTDRQSWLSERERQFNLKNAFIWNTKYTPPKSVLLIDDVYTTGSTLRECAKVLKKNKVATITAWTFFRTPKKTYA